MIIKRDFYLNQLIDSMRNGMIKVVTGLRRAGKSFLLFNLFGDYLLSNGVDGAHIIKFAFDSGEDLEKIGEDLAAIGFANKKVDAKRFDRYIKSRIIDDGTYYLLLDEIQLLESFETLLNGYMRRDNVDIYVTGSNAKFLSKDVITEFRGRGWQIHIDPLSYREFAEAKGHSGDDAYKEYITYGGLPKVLGFERDADKVKYLRSIFEETYIKDIVDRNTIKDMETLNDVLDFLASSIGSFTNPTRLANTFLSEKHTQIHFSTISRYLEFFEDSFLISKARRYDIKGKKYINAPIKYYFTDLGLRNTRLNFREFERPRLMENVVYNELVRRGYNVDVGAIDAYEKNKQGSSVLKKREVDFVCNQMDKRIYIQVALSVEGDDKLAQEEASLLRIPDGFKKIIIAKDIVRSHYSQNGIYLMDLYDFLLDERALE